MAPWVKALASKSGDLSSIPGPHVVWWKERTDSCKLPFDLHASAVLSVPHTHTHMCVLIYTPSMLTQNNVKKYQFTQCRSHSFDLCLLE